MPDDTTDPHVSRDHGSGTGCCYAPFVPRSRPNRADTHAAAPLGDAARDIAIRALARQCKVFPELHPDGLDRQVDAHARSHATVPLRSVDLALARSIYNAAVGRWLTLRWLLDQEIDQGFDALEPRARAVLLAGAAQLVFLDRVPAHAAINHAVEWAKSIIRPGAGGLVNAVLRRIAAQREGATVEPGPWRNQPGLIPLADGRSLRFTARSLPDDPADWIAIATSHPRELLDHWRAAVGEQRTLARALHGLIVPPTIINLEHARPADPSALAALTPHVDPRHAVLVPGTELTVPEALRTLPGAFVQDPAAGGAVRSIAGISPSPATIVDLCAGRGTKTRQLAALFPSAQIIATDTDTERLETLSDTFAGSERVLVLPYDAARERSLASADLVVLDVPCSNSGVLARRPEARYRFGAGNLECLAEVQRQILADSIPLLRPSDPDRGGPPRRILYSTCSLEAAENADQHRWMKRWHRFEPGIERNVEPSGEPGGAPAAYSDGGYSVLLTAP